MRTGRFGGELPALLFQGRNLRVSPSFVPSQPFSAAKKRPSGGETRDGEGRPQKGETQTSAKILDPPVCAMKARWDLEKVLYEIQENFAEISTFLTGGTVAKAGRLW